MPQLRPAAAVALAAASLVLSGCSALGGAGGTPTPTPTAADEVDVTSLAVGDCLDADSRRVTPTVPVVSCSAEHDSEVYAEITVPGDVFPGPDEITRRAVDGCTTAFSSFVGVQYEASTLDYAYYFPTEGSWATGDRRILCLALDPSARVTGTLEGAAR